MSAKKDVSYQRPVVVGFDGPTPVYNVALGFVVGMYGHRGCPGDDVQEGSFEPVVHT
ncbi:MAG: hypothetical protein GXP36_11745 [Actinobacteria bacterium]|nr:hypothetical protein [Actinomycetota bacterium]